MNVSQLNADVTVVKVDGKDIFAIRDRNSRRLDTAVGRDIREGTAVG